MDVVDLNGNSLSAISHSTNDAQHLVRVENISTLKQNAKVSVRLPNGTYRLEFIVQGSGADEWSDSQSNIASTTVVDFACEIRRTQGPKNLAEPISCVDVEDSIGTLAWSSGSSGVPFSMTIPAN
jgi:hypothetical protein